MKRIDVKKAVVPFVGPKIVPGDRIYILATGEELRQELSLRRGYVDALVPDYQCASQNEPPPMRLVTVPASALDQDRLTALLDEADGREATADRLATIMNLLSEEIRRLRGPRS